MADLDLTEAVDAAARAQYAEDRTEAYWMPEWENAHERVQRARRDYARLAVEAAAPLIAAQVRAETLREAAREFDVLADFFIQQAMTLKTDGARQIASAAAAWRQQAAHYLRDLAAPTTRQET